MAKKKTKVFIPVKSNIDRIEILRQGQQTDFWRILCERIEQRIETLMQLEDSVDFEELPPEQYKLKSQIMKIERKHLEAMRNYPDIMILELGSPEKPTPLRSLDPY